MQALPVAILLCVAVNQVRLAFNQNLSPWSGGGFGMFSTTDAATDRHLHIYESSPAMRRELLVPAEFEDAARRALALPNDRWLRSLAVRMDEHFAISSASNLEIQVWSNHYDAETLQPHSQLLGHYRLHNDAIQP
jgi:hypothetical protein